MRKLKLFLSMLMLIAFSVGNVWGADADVTYDFTGSDWSVSNGTLTNGTVSFTGEGGANFKMNSGYFILGKENAYINFPTYAKAVEKIVVTGRSGASGSVGQNIYVGNEAVSTATTGATGTNTYEIASASQAAGTTYTLKVTSNHNTQITKIEIFYVGGDEPGDEPGGGEEPGDEPGNDPTPSSDNLELTFDVSSNPGEWPTTNSYTQTNYTYTLNNVEYTFDLHNVKCNSGYLMLTQPAQLGLPAIAGYKLVKIDAKNSSGCSTSTKVRVTSSATDNTQIVSGGSEQTWSTQGSTYTYTLSETEANTMYYLWIANKNCQIVELKLYYDAVGDAPAVTVAKPTFSIAEGAYLEAKSVEIECTTEGASIYYTLDGNDPTSASTPYEGAISITETKTLKAIAIKGETSSSIASATYTIVSTEHAGTAEDPYSVADARIVIDAVGTTGITDKYVAGIISNVKSLDPSKYVRAQYYISDNGERENEVYVYNGYYLNGADFTANDQIMVGDEVVVKGNLVKYNTTYEIDQNSQIVSLEREKQASGIAYDTKAYIVKKGTSFNAPVLENPNNLTVTYVSNNANVEVNANTGEITLPTETAGVSVEITATFEGNATYNAGSAKYTVYVAEHAGTAADPLTVADAQGLIDGISTMDNVFVKGIINEVSSFNSTYSSITYWISDNGESKDLQVYSGKGLNSADFTELADLQVADEVVVCGTLKKYNSTYEFDKNNYLASLVRKQEAELAWDPADDIELTVGDEFTAPTLSNPNNIAANEITIASSNTALATVTNGAVALVADATGEATITATFAGNDNFKAAEVSYKITVNAAAVVPPTPTTACNWDLTAASFDTESNTQVTWSCDQITMVADKGTASTATNNYLGGAKSTTRFYKNSTLTFTPQEGYQITSIVVDGESGRAAAFGESNNWTNATASIDDLVSTITPVDGTEPVIISFGANAGATAISVSYEAAVVKANPELAWDPADDIELTVGDAFTAPSLTYAQGFNGVDAIVIASDNESVAKVVAGVVELVADATGEATITASFAGNDTYKKATASYKITVNEQAAPLSPWASVYTSNVEISSDDNNKKVVIGGEEFSTAKTNKGGSATITLPQGVTEIHMHIVAWKNEGHTITVSGDCFDEAKNLTVLANENVSGSEATYDLGESGTDYYLMLTPDKPVAANTVITLSTTGTKRIVLFGVNQVGGIIPVLKSISITGEATELEYEDGDVFNPAGLGVSAIYTLNDVDQDPVAVPAADIQWEFDPATLTIGTTSVTVTATVGEKSDNLVVNGLSVIDATPEISTDVNNRYWTVDQDAAIPDAKTFAVTLKNVAAATAVLGGTNPEAFNIDKTALVNGDEISVSVVSTATAGIYTATITISDNAGVAEDKVVNVTLTVKAPEVPEAAISTSTEWVAATAADLVDGAEVIITGVKDEVVYAMGEQKSTNRAAYVASVDGEGVLTPGAGTMSFTLVAQATEGVFALRTSNGKYLYAAASGSNHLKTQDEVDVNAQWTLAVNSAVAKSSTNRNIMRFNGSGENKLFSCYSSGQTEIQFYVPKPVTPEPQPEVIRDGLEAGKWGTLCPTQNISEVEGAEFFQISYLEELGGVPYNMVFDAISGTTLEAGKPYFFIANAGEIRGIKTGTVLDEADQAGVNGFYGYIGAAPMNLTWRANYDGNENNTFVIYNNSVFRITGNTQLKSERCYININSTEPSRSVSQPAPGRRRINMAVSGTQVATGIDAINATDAPVKMMIDGQLFILRGEKMYDATGRLVK